MKAILKSYMADYLSERKHRNLRVMQAGKTAYPLVVKVNFKHRSSESHKQCFVSLDLYDVFSLVENPVDLHLHFGFSGPDNGQIQTHNPLQWALVLDFFKDDELISEILVSVLKASDSEEVPKEAKKKGRKVIPLNLEFELLQCGLKEVMLVSILSLGEEILFRDISSRIGREEVRLHMIVSLKRFVKSLRSHYAKVPVESENKD